MSKRFTDTNKYKKPFIRSLKGPYKLLWDYLYHECDHAGIWHKDFEVAQIYLGPDMPVNEADALMYFNQDEERVEVLNGGSKWFIRPFVDFQYGILNPSNRLHASVLNELQKHRIKVLTSPLEGAKDKDKDTSSSIPVSKEDRNKTPRTRARDIDIPPDLLVSENEIRDWLEYKAQKNQTYKPKGLEALWRTIRAIPPNKRRETVDNSMSNNWAGLYEKRDNGSSNGKQAKQAGYATATPGKYPD